MIIDIKKLRVIISSGIAVSLVVVSAGVLSGRVPGFPMREGPLEGPSGVTLAAPVRAEHTGAIWGSLVLENHSGSAIVLDSVTVADNPQNLPQTVPPYLWDKTRIERLGFATVDRQLPLPAEWRLPERLPVQGHVLEPAPDDAEVLIEFGVPQRTSTVSGITVRYHVGWLAYRKTFDLKLTLCPPADRGACRRRS